MPFPSDEKVMALAKDLLEAIDALFGVHPGFRAVHAKGVLLEGTFSPSPGAVSLTRALHVTRPSTPVFARFSNNTGIPVLPDTDPNAQPRGLAVRFQLAEHVHTDIVSHSTNGFPAKDGPEFLALLRAIGASATSKESPSPIEAFLGAHPAALAFVQAPKPVPSSFARESFFGVTAVRFTNASGASRHGRYRFVPDAGTDYLDAAALAKKSGDFLFDELEQRLAAGPIGFKLMVQLANDDDVANDATVHWPEDRPVIELGKFVLTDVVPDNTRQQKVLIFDPIPRIDGLEPSADPLLELRAAIYLLSGRRRRQAPSS